MAEISIFRMYLFSPILQAPRQNEIRSGTTIHIPGTLLDDHKNGEKVREVGDEEEEEEEEEEEYPSPSERACEFYTDENGCCLLLIRQ
jgi:hypothetical protein